MVGRYRETISSLEHQGSDAAGQSSFACFTRLSQDKLTERLGEDEAECKLMHCGEMNSPTLKYRYSKVIPVTR